MAPPTRSGPGKRDCGGSPKEPKSPTCVVLGKKTFQIGENIFALWDDGKVPRWFAATVAGTIAGKLAIKWAEGHEVAEVDPNFVLLAKDVLLKDTVVGLPDKQNKTELYRDYAIVKYRESGRCSVRGKKGVIVERLFAEMMIEPCDLVHFSGTGQVQDRSALLTGYCFLVEAGVHGAKEILIKNCGGLVVDTVKEMIEWRSKDSINLGRGFLLADKPVSLLQNERKSIRDEKFLYCLAANIPCLSSEWLTKLWRQKKMVDYEKYRQLAGCDDHPGKGHVPIPWVPRKTLLNNLRIAVFGDAALLEEWKPILEVGKGEVMCLEEENFASQVRVDRMDVVMVERFAPADLIRICRDELVPLVTKLWLSHTVIYGRRRPFELYRPMKG